MIIHKKIIFITTSILLFVLAYTVNAEYHSSTFGGIVTVEETPDETNYTYHTSTFGGSVTVESTSTNEMYIVGDESAITTYGNFNISVYLDPVDYVSSWEFSLQFNESALQVVNRAEGDFFTKHGQSTFGSDGTVGNNNGTINLIYYMSLDGNTSDAGYLFNITFEPVVAQGTSWINFNTTTPLGITNETEYLDLNYENGTVTLDITDFPSWTWSSVWRIGKTSVCDFDEDMDVDSSDLSVLLSDYLKTEGFTGTDVVEDGLINYLDRSLLQNRLGESYG